MTKEEMEIILTHIELTGALNLHALIGANTRGENRWKAKRDYEDAYNELAENRANALAMYDEEARLPKPNPTVKYKKS